MITTTESNEFDGTSITIELHRGVIDPAGESSDEQCSDCENYIHDAICEAFPGADVRVVGVGGRTSGITVDNEIIDDEVRDAVDAAWQSWLASI